MTLSRGVIAGVVTCLLVLCASGAQATRSGYGSYEASEYVGGILYPYPPVEHGQKQDEARFMLEANTKWWLPDPQGWGAIAITPPSSLGYASIEVDPSANSLKAQAAANGFGTSGGRGYAWGYLKGVYEVTSPTLPPGTDVPISGGMELTGYFEMHAENTYQDPTYAREMLLLRELENQEAIEDALDPDYYWDAFPPIMEGGPHGYLDHLDLQQTPNAENTQEVGGGAVAPSGSPTINFFEPVTVSDAVTTQAQVGDVIMMETMLNVWATGQGENEIWANYGNSLQSSISSSNQNVNIIPYGAGALVADPDGPYTIAPGDSLFLDARGSSGSGGISEYLWQIAGIEFATGDPTTTFSWPQLESTFGITGMGQYDVGLWVTDSTGDSEYGATSLNVTPEPATCALLGTSIAAMLVFTWRRRERATG